MHSSKLARRTLAAVVCVLAAPALVHTAAAGKPRGCSGTTVFADGAVRVIKKQAATLACNAETGRSYPLRAPVVEAKQKNSAVDFGDFQAAGPFLVYAERVSVPGSFAYVLLERNTRTGARRELTVVRQYGSVFGVDLLPDGTVAFGEDTSPPGSPASTALYRSAPGARKPELLDEGSGDFQTGAPDPIDRDSFALAPDGTAYWRNAGEVKSAPPSGAARAESASRSCDRPAGIELFEVSGVKCEVGLEVFDRYQAGNKKPLKFRCRKVNTERGKSVYCAKEMGRRTVVWTLPDAGSASSGAELVN